MNTRDGQDCLRERIGGSKGGRSRAGGSKSERSRAGGSKTGGSKTVDSTPGVGGFDSLVEDNDSHGDSWASDGSGRSGGSCRVASGLVQGQLHRVVPCIADA